MLCASKLDKICGFYNNGQLHFYGLPSVLLQKLTNEPSLRTSFEVVWTSHIGMKNCFHQHMTNRIV